MAVKTEVKAEPMRQWIRLDSIANARRAGDVDRRRREIVASENSMNAMPINVAGGGDRSYMNSMIMDQIAVKREQLREIEFETGDQVVVRYCQDILGPQPVTGVTINGEPLARGSAPSMIAPGMPR